MSQPTNTLMLDQPNRLIASMHYIVRSMRKLSTHLAPVRISELLVQLEEVTTPARLTKIVNRVQNLLWKLPATEQAILRKQLMIALTAHVLEGPEVLVRIEAAGWLRLLMQAGLVSEPHSIFVTLVTATTNV